MPLPKRNAGEDRDVFISRCISEISVLEPSWSNKQQVAVCYAQLHDSFKNDEVVNRGDK